MVDQTGWEALHYRLYETYLGLKRDNRALYESEVKLLKLTLGIRDLEDRESVAKSIRDYSLATVKQDINPSRR